MTTDLTDQLRQLAEATDPARDPLTLEELHDQRSGRGQRAGRKVIGAVAAAFLAALAASAVVAGSDGGSARPEILTEAPTASEGTNIEGPLDATPTDEPVTSTSTTETIRWPPETRELPATDPAVEAVLRLLPPSAQLQEARDVRTASKDGADYIRVVASLDGVEYEVSVHRDFDETELSDPIDVPGGLAWPGRSGPDDAYLYFLSDAGVGLYLAATGDVGDDVASYLMELARRVATDPVVSAIRSDP